MEVTILGQIRCPRKHSVGAVNMRIAKYIEPELVSKETPVPGGFPDGRLEGTKSACSPHHLNYVMPERPPPISRQIWIYIIGMSKTRKRVFACVPASVKVHSSVRPPTNSGKYRL